MTNSAAVPCADCRTGQRMWCARFATATASRAIFSKGKAQPIVAARREAIYRVKLEKPAVSSVQLGRWFNRHHSTIIFALARFQELTGAPALSMRRPTADTRRAA